MNRGVTDMKHASQATDRANLRIVGMCVGLVIVMGGLAYASVPLYDLFCRVTGYGGTTQRVESADGVKVIDRKINVRFDANTASRLDWDFGPERREVTLQMGERGQMVYLAKNLSDKPIVGTASFNVTPQAAGMFFNKMECFCFTDTYIEPGQTLEMPVVFYVDPDMAKEYELENINTITLSYTFFESRTPVEEVLAESRTETDGKNEEEKL